MMDLGSLPVITMLLRWSSLGLLDEEEKTTQAASEDHSSQKKRISAGSDDTASMIKGGVT